MNRYIFGLCMSLVLCSCSYKAQPPKELKLRADAKLLLQEDYEQGGFSPGWNGSFVQDKLYPSGVTPFVQVPGHGYVMQQYIPEGTDEVTPAQSGVEGEEAFARVTGKRTADEFYVEWEEFYPEDHAFAKGAQKMLRFTYWDEGTGRGPGIDFWNQYGNRNLQLAVGHPKGSSGVPIDIFRNTHSSIPRGQWVKFGVGCKLNTPGKRDGFAYAYKDGREIARMEGISNRGDDTRGFNIMWVGGNHTNQGKTRKASIRYIDNIKWYATWPYESER